MATMFLGVDDAITRPWKLILEEGDAIVGVYRQACSGIPLAVRFVGGDRLLWNSMVQGTQRFRQVWVVRCVVACIASSHGAVTLQDNEGKLFKVNGQHLKVFYMSYNSSDEFDVINLVEFDTISNSSAPK